MKHNSLIIQFCTKLLIFGLILDFFWKWDLKFSLVLTFRKYETSEHEKYEQSESPTSVRYDHGPADSSNKPEDPTSHLLDQKYQQ